MAYLLLVLVVLACSLLLASLFRYDKRERFDWYVALALAQLRRPGNPDAGDSSLFFGVTSDPLWPIAVREAERRLDRDRIRTLPRSIHGDL